jgi:acyl carrier protein
MTREDVMAVVIKHLKANVDNLDDVTIDPTQSMVVYGASSLDLVEIVSCAMRELGIKLPRTALAGVQNIDGLVDMLFEAKVAV